MMAWFRWFYVIFPPTPSPLWIGESDGVILYIVWPVTKYLPHTLCNIDNKDVTLYITAIPLIMIKKTFISYLEKERGASSSVNDPNYINIMRRQWNGVRYIVEQAIFPASLPLSKPIAIAMNKFPLGKQLASFCIFRQIVHHSIGSYNRMRERNFYMIR